MTAQLLRWCGADRQWQAHSEGAALARPLAMHGDRTTVQADQLFDDRQPETDTMLAGFVALPKAFEDRTDRSRFDPFSSVRHDDLDVGIYPLEANLNFAALGRELDGIGNQVPYDLLESSGISRDRIHPGVQDLLDRDRLRFRSGAHALDAGLYHLGQVDSLYIEPQPPAFDP